MTPWGGLLDPRGNRWPPASAAVDLSVPNVARIYGAWLGGKDNMGADRDVANRVAQAAPFAVESARANRAFLRRAVSALARAGIDQFLDLGSGLPTAPNVHQIAHRVNPRTRTVYLDWDPVVLVHARALLTGPRTIAVAGDLRDPEAILADPHLRAHLDLSRPIGLLLVAVMHFISDSDDPVRVTGAFRDALAPGSHLVLSHAADLGHVADLGQADAGNTHLHVSNRQPDQNRYDPALYDARVTATREAVRLYEQLAGPFTLRTPTQIRHLFDGFDLLAPGIVPAGIVPARDRRPDRARRGRRIPILAGVGRLPTTG